MEQLTTALTFGPFRLLPVQRQVWKGEELLELRAMPLAVLTYLAQHPERVVSAEELRKAVWGGIYVSRTAIRVCVREIRQALGDEAGTPRYIETVGRQGYCFIGYGGPEVAGARSLDSPHADLAPESVAVPVPFVGRQRELAQLRRRFAQAQQEQRQVVLVSGEPGIGKTTLIQQFLQVVARLPVAGAIWMGYGQCIEAYGQGEAYLPLLEALGRLGREASSGKLRRVLEQHAPTWLAQLPALADVATRGTGQQQVASATQERMLRELCDALAVLTVEQPLLLVLEDLHWSDTATLAWLAAVARRPDPARLLVIGTYRPADMILHTHPLRGLIQELRAHRLCREVRLEGLGADQVQEYVRQRFVSSALAEALGPRLYERTDGNPLFLTASVDSLIQQEVVIEEDDHWVVRGDLAAIEGTIPEDLQQLITKQVEALSAEAQLLLGVASVSGQSFTAAEVAAGCKLEPEASEEACEQLAFHGHLIEGGEAEEWPDGTLTARYHFRHALFRDVMYRRLGAGQRVRLHRAILERLEAGYGDCTTEIASELAEHSTQGRDYNKGAKYHLHAADHALRLNAYREVITHCQQGLGMLVHVPETLERDRQELALRLPFHVALSAVRGQGSQEVEENLTQAQALARTVNDEKALVSMTVALGRLYVVRADRAGALRIADEDARLVEQVRDPALAILLHTQLGTIHTFCAEYAQARAHYTQVQTLYAAAEHQSLIFSAGLDPLAAMYSLSSLGLWLAGWPDQSRRQQHSLLARAASLPDIFTRVYAQLLAAFLALLWGDLAEARQLADQGVHLATQHGSLNYLTMGRVVQGCIVVRGGDFDTGLTFLNTSVPDYRATGAQSSLPVFLSFLAEALLRCGQSEEAFATITEALQLSETTLEVCWEAELYRVKGELTLRAQTNHSQVTNKYQRRRGKAKARQPMSGVQRLEAQAEECFLKAIEIAHRQEAKSLELRAAMNLSRLWQHQGKLAQARQLLAETYGWFTEGFDTKDLQEATALLEEMA